MHPRRPVHSRRGAALLFVLVTLFVASLIMVTLAQGVVRQHRQQRLERDHWQAELVADAAVDRLQILLENAPASTRQTWSTVPDETRPQAVAESTAEVTSTTEGYRLTVLTEYPAGSPFRIRIRREITGWQPKLPTTTATDLPPVSALNLENVP
ncbi:hypothetical protein GC163_15070 [bacterium]|nr:hypothetical protein [bacterium]